MPLLAGSNESAITAQQLPPEPVIFGQTPAMRDVRQKLERVAGANLSVLVSGESGTGKDIIARLLHLYSPWGNGPFVKVNCPAIPGTLLESELFGYERGAFTGAHNPKPGRVEMAHRGTLFLDEIGELDPMLQAKLLQLLQDGQFSRIGAQEDKKVEVRVVCSTNRELHEEIEQGHFRSDLFYRIAAMTIHLPPLARSRGGPADHRRLPTAVLQRKAQRPGADGAPGAHGEDAALLLAGQYPPAGKPGQALRGNGHRRCYLKRATAAQRARHVNNLILDGPVSLKKLTRQTVRKLEARIILNALHANNWNRKRRRGHSTSAIARCSTSSRR